MLTRNRTAFLFLYNQVLSSDILGGANVININQIILFEITTRTDDQLTAHHTLGSYS